MGSLEHTEVVTLFVAVAILLAVARILGELCLRFRQPAVLGELTAGILLGPTCLGAVAPDLNAALFPATGAFPVALDALTRIAIAMFLLVAGMEVDLSRVWSQGRAALTVATTSMIIPFILGFAAAAFVPHRLGAAGGNAELPFMLFFATALSISALPVIAKILLDLNLFRTDIGVIIVAAAILNDLLGWIIFALVLGLMGANATGMPLSATVTLVLVFVGAALTVGRWLVDRLLPWIQAHTSWPGGVLSFALVGALGCAAFTEWMGVHAVFGAFVFGVILGDSRHLREHTRTILEQFISFIFAPLFFATVGLRVDFAAHFDLGIVALVLVLATIGKLLGGGLGAWWAGLPPREAIAIGSALNARGAMEIILALLAYQARVIGESLFVAIVIMALLTSMLSGSAIQVLLKPQKRRRFIEFLASRGFCGNLEVKEPEAAIRELTCLLCNGAGLDAEAITAAVLARERIMSTALTHGLATPHARIDGLTTPIVGVGLCPQGLDFDAMDGRPTTLVFLILTPSEGHQQQLEILADIARTFRNADMVEKALRVSNYTQFLALVRSVNTDGSAA